MTHEFMTVADVPQRESIVFISDSQEVLHVLENIGMADCKDEYESLFVEVGEGDYLNIWAMGGIVPWLNRTVIKIL